MVTLRTGEDKHSEDLNKLIEIEVADEGIGMSKEDTVNLFTPFFRSKNEQSREKNPNGNGLGLSICYKIAKSLNGNLTCHSKIGIGTSFKFNFIAMECSEAEGKMLTKKKKKKNAKANALDVILEVASQEDVESVSPSA